MLPQAQLGFISVHIHAFGGCNYLSLHLCTTTKYYFVLPQSTTLYYQSLDLVNDPWYNCNINAK